MGILANTHVSSFQDKCDHEWLLVTFLIWRQEYIWCMIFQGDLWHIEYLFELYMRYGNSWRRPSKDKIDILWMGGNIKLGVSLKFCLLNRVGVCV